MQFAVTNKHFSMSAPQRWFPLESNPVLLNRYAESLGFSTDVFGFSDVYSTEEWATSMIPKPVLAVIFLYPISDVQEQHRKEEQSLCLSNEDSKAKGIWWTKQRIGNACGTIGILHSLANLPIDQDALIRKNSWLDTFLRKSLGLENGVAKAELLEQDTEIASKHDKATSDETNATDRGNIDDKVLTHFVAFVNVNSQLYELDGRKDGPVPHGALTSDDSLLEDACKVIQKFVQRDPSELRFTILALCPKQD